MKWAACSLAEQLGLPRPALVDGLLDATVWSTDVFHQGPVPVDVPQEDHDSGDDSDSDDSDSDTESED